MRTIMVALLLVLAAGREARPQGAATAQDLLEQAILAQGGVERLNRARLQTRSGRGEIVPPIGDAVPYDGQVVLNLPTQGRWTFDLNPETQKLRLVVAINGDKGWRSSGGPAVDMTKDEAEGVRDEAYVAWLTTLVPLRGKQFELTALAQTPVHGRPAVGIQVVSKGRPDAKLYFDKQTMLLVKVERKGKEAGLPVVKEYLFSEHKDFDGLKLPTRVVEMTNGKKRGEVVFTGYQFPPRLDESQFSKP
jgi:hypothetical protein